MTAAPLPTLTESAAPYWQAATEGRFVLPRCRACQRFHHHPRAWCPYCWSTDLEWDEPSGGGTVLTYTVVHQPPSPAFTAPYVLAIIELAEGPRMMANVIGCSPEDVRVGTPVTVTFERRGELAIPQFRPTEVTSS